jgi:deoxyribonuclease-4
MGSNDSHREKKKENHEQFPLLGAHLSIAGGLHKALYRARDLACTALQVFTKNTSTWKERNLSAGEIDRFKTAVADTRITRIAAHTSYLINLASPDHKKQALSAAALRQELLRSSQLSVPFVVLHPGAYVEGRASAGIHRISEHINRVLSALPANGPRLLLETTAGQGTNLGHRFEQLAAMIARIERRDKIGVCLDTSHIFAAGYDIRTPTSYMTTMASFDAVIGMHNLQWVHLNDTKKGLNSRVDRHAHIGEGHIGIEAFRMIMNDQRFRRVPKVIETPKLKDADRWDKKNLEVLRALVV